MALKAADNLVGGHVGPLVDDSGHFYKPLQSRDRGSKEVDFYTSFSSNPQIPDNIRRFFPAFHGTRVLEASDGSGMHSYLVLEDVVGNKLHPSVMDIKMGSRTWYPQSSEDYVQTCLVRDRESSSLELGFRISGLQTYLGDELGYYKPEKKQVKEYLKAEDVRLCLRKFVSSNPQSNSKPDCVLAASVYGGSDGILSQLLELKLWFEEQTMYQFNSCSVLMIYEETAKAGRYLAEVKLVDFAHVKDGQGVIDHNFLGGLCSLIKFVSEITNSGHHKGENVIKKTVSPKSSHAESMCVYISAVATLLCLVNTAIWFKNRQRS